MTDAEKLQDFKPEKIKLAIGRLEVFERYEEINALIHADGTLAVGRGAGGAVSWVVHHVSTGRAVVYGYGLRRDAIAACRRLAKYDWRFRSPKSRKIRKLGWVVNDEETKLALRRAEP